MSELEYRGKSVLADIWDQLIAYYNIQKATERTKKWAEDH